MSEIIRYPYGKLNQLLVFIHDVLNIKIIWDIILKLALLKQRYIIVVIMPVLIIIIEKRVTKLLRSSFIDDPRRWQQFKKLLDRGNTAHI